MKQISCNKCGKEIKSVNGIPREDYIHIRKAWGYFSRMDGRTQEFCLCEECANRLEKEFVIPSKWCDTTEML